MGRYLSTRLLESLIAVWGACTLVFFLIRVSGDPVLMLLPPGAPKEAADQLRAELGFDRPLTVQYVDFLKGLVTATTSDSLIYGRNAFEVVFERLPATAMLAVTALLLGVIIGGTLGLIGARWRGTPAEIPITFLTVLGQAVPTFWFGLMLIMIFAVTLEWLPVGGFGGISHLVLPAVTLALYTAASIGRISRVSLLTNARSNFIRTGEAKGLTGRRILLRHIIPNAMLPVVTVVGLQAGQLLGGTVVTEIVFGWPGVGQLLVTSIENHDFPVVEAAIVTIATIFVVVNLATDLLYGVLDPRIRLGAGAK